MYNVLIAHNFYRSATPSGESIVFDAERKLLCDRGVEVHEFTRHSDAIDRGGWRGGVSAAIGVPWNQASVQAIRNELRKIQPDIVHVHNTFPLLSPAIFWAIGHRAARVLTLHNYRLFCPAAIPMRDGKICTECLDRHSVISSLKYGCYRNSRLATIPLAGSVALHRMIRTWKTQVDAFICLTEFQKKLMVEAGLPAAKVHVKPNFYPGTPKVLPWEERSSYVVFAGRLTAEKGVVSLLRAWQILGKQAPELRLVGEGDLKAELERMAVGLPIRFLGQVSAEEAQVQIANARLLVLPSEWFEGFPMVVREAFAFGTPAAVSDIGPLSTIVEQNKSGVLFEPGNPDSLAKTLYDAWSTPNLLQRLGRGARLEFEQKYTEEANYTALMDIYRAALEASHNG